jgi:hypothetical protein
MVQLRRNDDSHPAGRNLDATNELQAAKEGLSGVRPRAARQLGRVGLATTVPEESN